MNSIPVHIPPTLLPSQFPCHRPEMWCWKWQSGPFPLPSIPVYTPLDYWQTAVTWGLLPHGSFTRSHRNHSKKQIPPKVQFNHMKLLILYSFELLTQQFCMVQTNRIYLAQSNFNFFLSALLLSSLLIFKPINLLPNGQELTLQRTKKVRKKNLFIKLWL